MRAAILAATAEILDEAGWEAVTFEEVAARAGVHKTTVYRRWPSRTELVFEAVRDQADEAIPMPDTGSLVGDLRLVARGVVAHLASETGARRTRSIIAVAAGSDDVTESIHAFWAHRMAVASVVVRRAIERGELAHGVDPTFVVETVVAPLWLRLLVTGEPIDEAFADAVVDLVTAGLNRN